MAKIAQILIIEDDNETQEMLNTMLAREGYGVLVASNGQTGINIFTTHPVDLIITDIIMPGKDGIDVIDYFLNNYPEVSIIVISGGGCVGPDDWLHLVKHMGVIHTFKKPFKHKDFLRTVKKILPLSEKTSGVDTVL